MATTTKRRTVDALEIIDDRYFKGKPEMYALLEEARERLQLAMQLHELREKEGLTQKEVADRVGTSRSVIARLEQPGYEKHTVSTLRKVAGALGYAVKVEFVPVAKAAASKSPGGARVRKAVAGKVVTKAKAAKAPAKKAKMKA